MTVRARISGGLLLLLACAGVETVIVILARTAELRLQDTVAREAAILTTVTGLRRELAEVKAARRGFLLSGAENFNPLIDRSFDDSMHVLASLHSAVHTDVQRAQLREVRDRLTRWRGRWSDLEPLSRPGNELVVMTDARFAPVEQAVSVFEREQQALLDAHNAQTARVVALANGALIGIPVIAMVIIAAMLVSVRRSILAPLAQLTKTASEIEAGRTPIIESSQRDDEIGVLTNAIRSMALAVTRREEQLTEASVSATEAAEELRTTLDTVPVGLMIFKTEPTRLLTQNPAAQAMLGTATSGLSGDAAWQTLALSNAETRERWPVARALQGERIEAEEFELQRPDGTVCPLLTSAAPLHDRHGNLRGAVVVFQDITRLRELDRMKDEFVSIVSHELRTPLTSIRGALQLVLSDPDSVPDGEYRELLTIGLNNCERLIRIINDILDISKMEAGRLVLQPRPTRVSDLMRLAVQAVSSRDAPAGVRIEQDLPADLPLIEVDPDRLIQVFVNLLSNAMKFAPQNSVVRLRAWESGPDSVGMSISDSGAGMSAEDLPLLFQKFRQIDGSSSRRKGGTGLGLAITKAIIEQHGGTISVESAVGVGTTFTLTLPRASDAAHAGKTRHPVRPHLASGRAVLLVDDDADFRLVMRRQLEAAGYAVEEAEDGAVALELARRAQPAVVILDLVMPNVDGWEFLDQFTADPTLAATPVIVVTAATDRTGSLPPSILTLAKPTDMEEMLREVGHAAGNARETTILLAEDDDDARRVLADGLRRKGMRIVVARDGEEALELFGREVPDLLLVDLRMPRIDGFELIRRVRSLPAGQHVPIVVISGSELGTASELRALRLGATAFLPKTVDTAVLARRVRDLIGSDAVDTDERGNA